MYLRISRFVSFFSQCAHSQQKENWSTVLLWPEKVTSVHNEQTIMVVEYHTLASEHTTSASINLPQETHLILLVCANFHLRAPRVRDVNRIQVAQSTERKEDIHEITITFVVSEDYLLQTLANRHRLYYILVIMFYFFPSYLENNPFGIWVVKFLQVRYFVDYKSWLLGSYFLH